MQNFEPQLIDLNFANKPGVIGVYVWDTGDGLALVDTGPGSTLEALEGGLRALGAGWDDVRHILITHIHFDHAGAAGRITELSPRAQVYVQERGARHLVSPERLYASAKQIYGNQMETLWGEMRPLDPERVTALSGGDSEEGQRGESVHLGLAEVRALYTPGHAIHHLAYHVGDELYVGDVGGVRLKPPGQELEVPGPSSPGLANPALVQAPTPPPDIDPAAWRRSAELLRDVDARRLHLPHFGTYRQEAAHWDALVGNLEAEVAWMREHLPQVRRPAELDAAFGEWMLPQIEAVAPEMTAAYAASVPPAMNVMGLAHFLSRAAGANRDRDQQSTSREPTKQEPPQ